MLGWLNKKNHDARIYMCLKEIKWELESSDQVRRARILAVASLLREQMRDPAMPLEDLVNRPLDYARTDLLELYEGLENIRNGGRVQLAQTKKSMKRFGMDLPDFAEEHFNLVSRALEVWMVTIGAGIAPNRKEEVREIWKMLSGSKACLDEAIEELIKVEEKTSLLTGTPADMFAFVDLGEWKSACDFVPEQFSKTLAIA